MPESVAVVLAGGDGERFAGGRKALATIDGRPMLARVLGAGTDVTDATPVVAVASDEQRRACDAALARPVRYVRDDPDRAGPLAGLAGAVTRVEAPWVLALACDVPLVDPAALSWLAARRGGDVDAVVPRTTDGTHPLVAWYRRDALADAIPATRGTSVRSLFDALAVRTVPAADAPDGVDVAAAVRNVNTVVELRRVRERVAGDP